MNDTNTAATALHPTRPQPAAWHTAPARLPTLDDEAATAVCDSGRIRVGAAFRLVTRR